MGDNGFVQRMGVFAEMTGSRRGREYFHGNYGLVGGGDEGLGPRFRGDDGGVGDARFVQRTGVFSEMTEGCGWSRVRMEVGYFHVNYGLVGGGDEGLGPRFRGDDGEAFREDDGGVGVRPS